MIHEWFIHFGAIAIVLFVVGFIPARAASKRHRPETGEDRMSKGLGTIIGLVATVGLLGLAFVLVCLGISGTYAGWAGMLVAGITIGAASTGD